MVEHHENTHKVVNDIFKMDDLVLVANYGKKKWQPSWYGPLRVVRATPLSTYQLAWGDGALKDDLVHQDRLKLAHLKPSAIMTLHA